MARHGVTYEEIVAAATQLKGQGRNITIENIRALLGTGSLATINKYLRQWRETQEAMQKIASKENLPENLISLVKGLWQGVITQASEQFAPQEEKYKQELIELKDELEKYQANNQRWQKLFNQWQQAKLLLDNEKLMLEQNLASVKNETTTLQAKQDNLLQQLQDKQDRINELYRLHTQAQDNLEHYRESAREQRLLDQQQFEQQKQQMRIEIKSLQEQVSLQRENLTVLQQSHQENLYKYSALEKLQHNTDQQLQHSQENLLTLEKNNAELKRSNEHWENQYLEQQKILENKLNSLADIQSEFKLTFQQLTDAKEFIKELRDQNRFITNEKLQLLQEKSQLEGMLRQLQNSIISS
jgi:hypothetical protein